MIGSRNKHHGISGRVNRYSGSTCAIRMRQALPAPCPRAKGRHLSAADQAVSIFSTDSGGCASKAEISHLLPVLINV